MFGLLLPRRMNLCFSKMNILLRPLASEDLGGLRGVWGGGMGVKGDGGNRWGQTTTQSSQPFQNYPTLTTPPLLTSTPPAPVFGFALVPFTPEGPGVSPAPPILISFL